MRYRSIELINYAGIYNGMGLTQIKINFDNCISNKIIIRGSNGSGKSTLMSAINPNPDSNDKFIPNAEARKNIHLTDNGIDYIIRYIHPITNTGRGTTKGYFSKSINGEMVELNPSGNISTCKEILYEEFNFDSAYVSLSQLSSEDKGLVDKKPVERKKLVNNITNSLDTFNNIYKSVSKRSSILKNLISNLTAKIDMIGDEAKVTARLNSIDKQIEIFENDKNKTIEAIAAVKLKITDVQNHLANNKYDEIVTELSVVNRMVKTSLAAIQSVMSELRIDDIDKLKSFSQYLAQQIIILESNITRLNESIPTLLLERENEYKDLQAKQDKLNALQSEYNYTDVKASMQKAKEIIANYESIFAQAGLMNVEMITKDEYDSAMEALKYLKDSAEALLATHSIEMLSIDIHNRSKAIEEINNIAKYKESLEQYRSEYRAIEQELTVARTKREIAAQLKDRPSNCTIDSCPYISSALEAEREYPESRVSSLVNRYNELDELIRDTTNKINISAELSQIRTAVGNIERELHSKIKFIKKLPVSKDFEATFMERVLSLDPFHDIDRLYPYIDCGNMIEEYKVAANQYKIYESEFKVYESKNQIIESILSDIEALQNKTNELAQKIDLTNQEILDTKTKLENFKSSKDKVDAILDKYDNTYLPNSKRKEELENIKNSLDVGVAQINELTGQLNQLNTNIGSINSDIKNLSDQREALRHSLIMLNEYKIELAKYNKDYVVIEKIKYYASPNTGIQSIFIGIFMNKILIDANNLLGMLFNGEFILKPFVVNESEFRIPCIGENGLPHDDISSMSMAQRSVISMIISFALLHQSSTKYNIVALDEIDGPLDTNNRIGFINLLDNLMNILKCEQAFIISHNSELITSNCDVILLKNDGNESITGNIIWKF